MLTCAQAVGYRLLKLDSLDALLCRAAPQGHIVGHIKAIGTDPTLIGVRPYTSNIPHGYHTDSSDIVGKPYADARTAPWSLPCHHSQTTCPPSDIDIDMLSTVLTALCCVMP